MKLAVCFGRDITCVDQFIRGVREVRCCDVTMNALLYLQIVCLANSSVMRENDRGKKDPSRHLCQEVRSTIYPTVGQTDEGVLKPIDFQPVNITSCAHPGTDCSGCKRKQNVHKVCSNLYDVSQSY